MTTHNQTPEQEARELAKKIAFNAHRNYDLYNDLVQKLTTLITKSRERDNWERSYQAEHSRASFIESERDSFREKAEALDWWELNGKDWTLFTPTQENNYWTLEQYKGDKVSSGQSFLEVVTAARKEQKS